MNAPELIVTKEPSPPPTLRPGYLSSPSMVLLIVFLGLFSIWPLLLFRYPPFMDHPSHLLEYNILAHFHSPLFKYDRIYIPNHLPVPNILNDYVTALLAQIFEIDFASRLTIACAVGLLPVAVWYYLSAARPGSAAWALFAVPMAWSRFVWFGNENFTLAVPLLFVTLGILVRWTDAKPPSRLRFMGLFALYTAIYFAHFLVFAVGGLAMTIHWLLGKRNLRTACRHVAPMVPGILFYLYWSASKGVTANTGYIESWHFNLMEKLQGLVLGVSPAPLLGFPQSIGGQCLIVSLMILMGYEGWTYFRNRARFPALLAACCSVLGLLFMRWTMVFDADARMWWITTLLGLALLPEVGKRGFTRICLFSIPLVIGTSFCAGHQFELMNRELAAVEQEFSNYPSGLRLLYFGDPSLPAHLHRCFEYYHLRKGGRTTMQFIGNEQAVCYLKGEFRIPNKPGYTIYDFTADQWLPYANQFDGALIIGNPSDASRKIISTLCEQLGFRVARQGALTLLLSPNWKPSE